MALRSSTERLSHLGILFLVCQKHRESLDLVTIRISCTAFSPTTFMVISTRLEECSPHRFARGGRLLLKVHDNIDLREEVCFSLHSDSSKQTWQSWNLCTYCLFVAILAQAGSFELSGWRDHDRRYLKLLWGPQLDWSAWACSAVLRVRPVRPRHPLPARPRLSLAPALILLIRAAAGSFLRRRRRRVSLRLALGKASRWVRVVAVAVVAAQQAQ